MRDVCRFGEMPLVRNPTRTRSSADAENRHGARCCGGAAAGADAIEDGGIATDVLLLMDDFFGDLFVITDEADQVEVG